MTRHLDEGEDGGQFVSGARDGPHPQRPVQCQEYYWVSLNVAKYVIQYFSDNETRLHTGLNVYEVSCLKGTVMYLLN